MDEKIRHSEGEWEWKKTLNQSSFDQINTFQITIILSEYFSCTDTPITCVDAAAGVGIK